MQQPIPSRGRVVIVGAGLGGLSLARILQLHNIPVKIYEKEPSPDSRDQGGSLDMHDNSGQLALQKAGLYEEFDKMCSREADHMRVGDKHGAILYDDPERKETARGRGDRPEIDRGVLRGIYIKSLLPDTIVWGHAVKSLVVSNQPSRYGMNFVLEFASGAIEVAEGLVVGADGTWSKIRPLLSDAVPTYSGVSFIELHINEMGKHPVAANILGPGTVLSLGDGKGILAQRNSGDRAKVYLALKVAKDWLHQLDSIVTKSPTEIKKYFRDIYSDWSPSLLEFIDVADDETGFIARPLWVLPIGHSWKNKPGVTLIGDAAHIMTPFAGEGANLAMLDGAELGEAIASAYIDESEGALAQAVEHFEAVMFERAKESAQRSADNMERAFSADAPAPILKFFEEVMGRGPPPSS